MGDGTCCPPCRPCPSVDHGYRASIGAQSPQPYFEAGSIRLLVEVVSPFTGCTAKTRSRFYPSSKRPTKLDKIKNLHAEARLGSEARRVGERQQLRVLFDEAVERGFVLEGTAVCSRPI